MRYWRTIRDIWEWLPLVGLAVLLGTATDWFTTPLEFDEGLILALLFIGNLALILVARGLRQQGEFLRKFPGFRGSK